MCACTRMFVDCNPINFRIMFYCRNGFIIFFFHHLRLLFRSVGVGPAARLSRGYIEGIRYAVSAYYYYRVPRINPSTWLLIERKKKEIIALTYYLFVIYLYLWLSRDDIFNYRNLFICFICKHLSLLLVSVRVPVPPGRPWIPLSRPNKNIPSCESVTYLYNIIYTIIVLISLLFVLKFTVTRSI